MKPQPPRVLVISSSNVTLTLFKNMFSGFHVAIIYTLADAQAYLQSLSLPLDFIILDDQAETHADELAKFTQQHSPLRETKIIHLYTPTTSLSGRSIFGSSTPGVVKMTKPPRKGRLLQTLAGLKNLPNTILPGPATDVTKAIDDLAAAQRTLYGNVLIAEGERSFCPSFSSLIDFPVSDNPIAQNLLVKQLERYQLNVTATSNGNEAIARKSIHRTKDSVFWDLLPAEWEAHEPGYFSVALFDHRESSLLFIWIGDLSLLDMPICDGVEAAKQLRVLEAKKKSPVMLPSALILLFAATFNIEILF